MLTINIYQDNELKKTFVNQKTDIAALKYLHQNCSYSTDWALKHEGWKVELIDEETKEVDYWKPYVK